MSVKMIILPDKPELGFVSVGEQSGLYLCSNCNDVLDQDLEMLHPLDTLCPGCRAELLFSKMRSGLTPHALDGRESAASQAVSSPEVLSTLQAVSNPALPQVM